MVGLNTPEPRVYWNGVPVTGIVKIKTDWEADEQRITFKVRGMDEAIYMQLVEAGIHVRRMK